MSREITIEFGKRLKELRIDNNYSMELLCELYNNKFDGNLNKGTLSRYENGLQEPLFTTVKSLAELFNARIEYLIGKDDNKYFGMDKVDLKKMVPILGVIAAGSPIVANEYIEGYEHTEDTSIDYCLRVKGDSMIGARIYDGDIVYVDKSSIVENGDIVVALVDGENATLKRYYKYGNTVILRPENPALKEMEFDIKDKYFKIIGKIKSVKFKV
jgi:repressor LexA